MPSNYSAAQLAAIAAEIRSDPAYLGYAARTAVGDDYGVAQPMNDPTRGGTMVAPMTGTALMAWAMSSAVLAPISAGSANASPVVASDCLALLWTMQGDVPMGYDLGSAAIAGTGGGLDRLTTAGVLPADSDTTGANPTPGSKAHLLAAASAPSSRTAQVLGQIGATIGHLDVAASLGRS